MKWPAYSKYKPSGVEWLGDVPEHWEVDRLKWTTTGTINGIWGEEPNGVDDLICVRVADFDRVTFRVIDEPPTLRAIDADQRKYRLLRRGDLLLEKSGGGEKQLVGCVVLFDHKFAAVCSNFVARMPISTPHSARFWSYAHAALYDGKLNYPAIKQTTGIQNLDSAAYLDIRVGLPPEAEQLTIADFLDRETAKIDTLVVKKRTLIERLKEKRTALISRTVTRGLPPDAARAAGLDPHPKLRPSGIDWLGDVPEHWPRPSKLRFLAASRKHSFVNGPFGSDLLTSELVPDGVPVVYIRDLASGHYRRVSEVCVTPEKAREIDFCRVDPGDVLIAKVGDPPGTAVVYPETEPNGIVTQDVIRLRVNRATVCASYLAYFLNSLAGRSLIDAIAIESTRVRVSLGDYKGASCLLPPLAEQESTALFLDCESAKIDDMMARVGTAIERLQEYRSALITAAVTGQIDVRGSAA